MDQILLQNYNNDPNIQAMYPSFEAYRTFMNNPERVGNNSGLSAISNQLGQNINQFVTQTIPSGLEQIRNFYGMLPTPGNLLMRTIDSFDRFDDLPQQDRNYITSVMEGAGSKQGLPGFYRDQQSGLLKDMMGKNVRSLQGNYADYIRKEYDRRFNEMNPNYVAYTSPLQLAKNSFIQKQFQKQQELAAKEASELAAQNKVRLGPNLIQDKGYKSDPGLSALGREKYTGKGMAFEARNTGTGRGPK